MMGLQGGWRGGQQRCPGISVHGVYAQPSVPWIEGVERDTTPSSVCFSKSLYRVKVEAWKTAGVRNITVRTNVTAGGLRGGDRGAGSGRDTGWGAREGVDGL